MKRKILVVDDNKLERQILTGLLKNDYDILAASGGKEALSVIASNYANLSAILLDLIMPDMDGFEVLKEMRTKKDWQGIPVIIASVLDDQESFEAAIELGANGFVNKPYTKTLIENTLQNAIRLRETAAMVTTLRTDRLTGLLNREAFLDLAEEMINSHESDYYVMSCFDIENFKVINDQYGTEVGDKVLLHVADTIKSYVDEIGGISCRVTADDFAILYPKKYSNSNEIEQNHIATTTLDFIDRDIRIRIGRYYVNDLSLSVSVMFDRAIMAAESIRGRYDVYIKDYSDSLRDSLLGEQRIINDMNYALVNHEFEPWFQAQYNHATGALIGAEALVRWKKNGEYISPAAFVPVFEKNGFIYKMDQYIWDSVCKIMRGWIDTGKEPLPVSVNISRCDVMHHHFVETITGIINKYDLPYDLIRLEVTESAFSESTNHIIAKVNELINLGFTVEIDDFGSGFSSLNTLKDVPASIMKLDMKFFENTGDSQRSGNIIESVVRMAKWLGMAVIAEGVEEKQQADYLKSIGCYYIQGYYYAKPVPQTEYEELLDGKVKESKLTRLQTLENLDNNEFWNPKSMETLIFNSYVGGACIFEYTNNDVEILRINDQYAKELGTLAPDGSPLSETRVLQYFDKTNENKLVETINEAIDTKKQTGCEIELTDGVNTEYIRITFRLIAKVGERNLFYGVLVNMTEQRNLEKRELENAAQLKVIMGNINGGVSAIQIADDGSSNMVFNNNKYYDLYDYTREEAEAINLDVMSLILPEDLPSVMDKVKKLKEDKIPVVIDYRTRKKNGKVAYIRANASMMHLEGYKDDVITSVLTDITEQREISDQLKAIIDNINGGVTATVVRNGKPEFIVVNDNYAKMLGYDTIDEYNAEMQDKYSGIYPDDRDRIVNRFETSDGGKDHYTMEYRIIRKDGAIRYIRNNISVISVFGVEEPVQLSVANDITDVYLAQQSEKEATDRLRTVMNHAGNGITAVAICGGTAEFMFANDRFYEIVGLSKEEYAEVTKNDPLAPIHPDDIDIVRKIATEANKTEKTVTANFRIVHKDGKTIWVKSVITLTRIYNISLPVQIAVYSDITDEVEKNEQLSFLNETAHDILAQEDPDKAINQSLEKVINYFNGERAYVFEFDKEHGIGKNTYEICKPGVTPEIDNLQAVPWSTLQYWFDILNDDDFVIIDSVSGIEEKYAPMRKVLAAQNIDSLIVAPVWREGKLIGFAGVDNPTSSINKLGRLKALGDYIAVLITRRDLNAKIKHDTEAINQLMSDIPGGFCRMRIVFGENPTIETFNDGFAALLGMTKAELLAEYGDNAYKYLSEDEIETMATDSMDAFKSTGQFTTKCTLRRKDSKFIRVMIFGRFVRDVKGKIHLNAYFTDITEQENAEKRRDKLLDNLTCGAALYMYDKGKFSVIHINKKYWELVERTPADYSKTSIVDFILEADRDIMYREIESAISQNRNLACDLRILCGDSTYKPFHVSASVVPSEDGRYEFYVTYNPISKGTMSIQEMLPIALSTMMSTSDDLSYVKDKSLRYVCCSKSVAKILGLKSERDIIGKTDADLFSKKLVESFVSDDKSILDNGIPVLDIMENIPTDNGGLRLSRTSKYPIMGADGSVVGIYGVSRDVTLQREHESQLELVSKSIPGGLAAFSFSDNGINTLYFNDGFYKFSGYSKSEYVEMTSKEPLALMLEEDRPRMRAKIQEIMDCTGSGEIRNFIFRAHTKSGSYRWLSLNGKLSKLTDNRTILNVVQVDISEQREREENLRIAEEEYRIAASHSGRTICRYNIAEHSIRISAEAAERLSLSETIHDVPYGRVKLGKISEDTSKAYIEFFESIMNGAKTAKVTFNKHLKDGWRMIDAQATTIFSDEGKPVSAVITYVNSDK